MRIKALKTFISSGYSASRGDTLEVPDSAGCYFVAIGFAEDISTTTKPKKKTVAKAET